VGTSVPSSQGGDSTCYIPPGADPAKQGFKRFTPT